MQPRSLARATSAAFMAAGACLALWAVLHPWNHLAGARVGGSTRWIVAHTFHFLSGLALLGAIAGFAVLRLRTATRLGTVAAGVWLAGAALWTGTGMITAFLWPTLAAHAPRLTEANGPIFSPPHPLIVATNLVFCAGMILTAVAMARTGALPPAAAALLAGGALVLLVPPHPLGPAPWWLFVAGGVASGVGTALLGPAVARLTGAADEADARERRAALAVA
ncbi:MAG TPA: hypothetical protein VFJ82_08710 [Longimicrobium sp.]|nr:hypothetical protein [Longimicrobium sp.]